MMRKIACHARRSRRSEGDEKFGKAMRRRPGRRRGGGGRAVEPPILGFLFSSLRLHLFRKKMQHFKKLFSKKMIIFFDIQLKLDTKGKISPTIC